jgi:hypothetical protein
VLVISITSLTRLYGSNCVCNYRKARAEDITNRFYTQEAKLQLQVRVYYPDEEAFPSNTLIKIWKYFSEISATFHRKRVNIGKENTKLNLEITTRFLH